MMNNTRANQSLSAFEEKAAPKRGALREFAAFYKPHLGMFLLDMFCALVIALVDILFPVVTRKVLYDYIPNQAMRTFLIVMGAMLAAFLIRTAAQWIVTYLGHLMGVHIEADMRTAIFAHMQKLGFSFYDKSRTGKLLSRCTNDLFDVTELAHHGPEDVFISMLTFIGAFVVMLTIEWRLALVLIAVVPVMLIFVMNLRKRMSRTSRKVKEGMAVINSQIESSISGARVAKAFTNEDYEISKFEQGNGVFVNSKSAYYKTMGMFMAGMEFFTTILNVIVLAVSGVLIMKGEMTTTTLIIFMMYISSFVTPIRKLSAFAEQYTMGMAGFKRFTELLDTEAEIQDKPDAIELKNVKGDIEFKNISFAYGSGGNVLENICLSIRHGQTLALVGPSGGGKTTLCHLLPRFYDITSGSITVDGIDIRDVTLSSLRRNIGIVLQEPFLYSRTIMENVRIVNPDAAVEEVFDATRVASVHDVIQSFENGYDTVVGEKGVTLSGGQKQRVAIARMLMQKAPIIVLDDSMSAVDTETDAAIRDALHSRRSSCTTFIISHRITTLCRADKILVLEGGRLVQTGTHEELLKQDGLYKRIADIQNLLEDELRSEQEEN